MSVKTIDAQAKPAAKAKPKSRKGALARPKVTETSLANGLRVLIVERRGDPVVAVMTWYKVGSKNEREHEAGVSHFLEHMMFKGAARFGKGEIDRLTTQLGGQNNAFTSYDHTAYWFELASDRWERALEVEADRMQSLALDSAEFAAERAVVLEELAMGQDDPWRVLGERVQAAAFGRHPYRRPIIGHPDALGALSVDQMRDYHRRFYTPSNATLVVCGDVDPSDALARIERHFGAIPRGEPAPHGDFRPSEYEPGGEQRLSMRWDDQGKRVAIAWPSARFASDDDFTLDVIAMLLSGGRLSRLYRKLVVEKELATSVQASNDTRAEGGLFWVMAECAQGVSPETLERAIGVELARLRRDPVSPRELSRVKAMLEASEAQDHETVSDLAEDIGENAIDAHWSLAFEANERVRRVGVKAVRECARRLLVDDRRVVGWCLPRRASPKAKR